jgi:glycosyltransferase involved in cell wall biosynthesis
MSKFVEIAIYNGSSLLLKQFFNKERESMTKLINWLMIGGLGVITLASYYFMAKILQLQYQVEKLASRPLLAKKNRPKVSIIVPIHNEETYLVKSMTALCSLNYPNYEVIAVNDRSNDSCQDILARLAHQFEKLSVITITHVPNGWLGKTNALQQGIEKALGCYIILTDADVYFAPTLVTCAIDYMIDHHLAHLTLSPQLLLKTPIMKLFMPVQIYSMLLAMKPWQINDKNPSHTIGIGAFNCVTKEALKTIGFMNTLALNPIDDLGLARKIKQYQLKQGYANPQQLLQLVWYETINDSMIGLEKNIFAFLNFSIINAFIGLTAYISFIFLPFVMLFIYPTFAILSIFAVLISLTTITNGLSISMLYVLLYPFAASITIFIGIRAVSLCIIKSGIWWGGLFFSLSDLKTFYQKNLK